jgi:hypothetical protein
MPKRYERVGRHVIWFDKEYYVAYAGGVRDLTKEKQRDWNKTLLLPGDLKYKEQHKLGWKNNPNVVPMKGIDIISLMRELRFVPLFDHYFEHTHLLKITDVIVYESIKQKSYQIAMQ